MVTIKWYQRLFIICIVSISVLGGGYFLIEDQKAQVSSYTTSSNVSEELLIAGGMPIGIYLETDGVLVIGTQAIKGVDGIERNPVENVIKKGDYIVSINNEKIESKSEIIEFLKKTSKKEVALKIRRDNNYIETVVSPVEDENRELKLGIWVRDNAQGLGTITFLNGSSEFGALGHGISDLNTGEILEISEGKLYETSIRNIVKGKSGSPGGLEGIIIYNHFNVLGCIEKNSNTGIYGKLDRVDQVFQNSQVYPVGRKENIHKGKATIRCCVDGKVNEYDIEIKDIDLYPREINKGIEIQVTDPELLSITGGIVQGMSGSPILQDGKIIGAITHVFIRDATKGYGIFIENMLENAK